MSDEIKVQEGVEYAPVEAASDPTFIKHVRCEGARFHVLWWDGRGTHCSEERCIINKPEEKYHQDEEDL